MGDGNGGWLRPADEHVCGRRTVGYQGSGCDRHNLDVSGSPDDGNRGGGSTVPFFRSHCAIPLTPKLICCSQGGGRMRAVAIHVSVGLMMGFLVVAALCTVGLLGF